MKKITDFIVSKRYFFLILFIIFSGVSLFLSTKVNINEDIMEYLPKTSETKIGKDIMETEFIEQDSSILNVMFKDLSENEKKDTLKKLENINGVSSVDYKNTDEFNKDNYTLYVLNVDDYSDSKTATNVYNYVKDNFKVAGISGSIYDENKPILQLWIVVLAVACAMVILIILSDSYIEPWLYLISIGIAIFINKGTNIIFDSVSSITNSIVAILQLALSMDYSIMLSNRYKQEKEKESNKVEAMKKALYQSFKAISSSSLTTIVGLIALVFMSFTIGRDLGFVLAKGVLLSLISIFFCLPALLLIFENLIQKTKKKTPNFNLAKLGKIIYKTRYIQASLIVILFVLAYIFKGNIGILFTDSEQDKVGSVFPATNQIAIVYNNKYEDIISDYCKELEKDKKIDQVLCYSNTINEKLAYDELNNKFKDLNQDVDIDEYLIKLIYYNYYNQDETNKMTLDEFIKFIKSDIYTNDNFNKSLDRETKDNLNLLENFTTSSLINKKRSVKEIANILNMNEEDAKNILIYYNSKNLVTKMTIKDFVNFMLNDVAKDSKYNSSLDKSTISKLQRLQNFTEVSKINKEMNSSELSNIFGLDKNLIEQLLLFYRTNLESNTKLTLNEFATFALEMSKNVAYKDMFSKTNIKDLTLLKTLSDNSVNISLNQNDMLSSISSLGLKLNSDTLFLLYLYNTGLKNENIQLTLSEFVYEANSLATSSYINIDSKTLAPLQQKIQSLNSISSMQMTKVQLYQVFEIDENIIAKIDSYIEDEPMLPASFVEKLLKLLISDNAIEVDKNIIANLQLANLILNNVKLNAKTLTETLNQNETVVSIIYGYHEKDNLMKISIKDLINLLIENQNNELFKQYLDSEKNILNLAYTIVNSSNSYNYKDISNITNTDKEQVKKIYGVYDYNYNLTTLSPLELTNLILNNKDNELLVGKISNSSISELNLVKSVMESTINKTKYTSLKLSELLNINNDTMSLLFSLYNSKYIKSNEEISIYKYVDFIIKDVMNNKDYSSNFDIEKKEKLTTINTLMNNSLNQTKYTSNEAFNILKVLSNNLDKDLLDLVYMYYGSNKEYNESWKMTIEEFVKYLNSDIITDNRFDDFITSEKRNTITDSKKNVDKSKKLIVSDKYSRAVLNTKYEFENKDTYNFINSIEDKVGNKDDIYVVGNSAMAVEMSKTFNNELNKITILTMIFIFVVVAITFRDLIIPFVLVLIIQTAVYIIMSFISFTGGSVYFISLLIVQAILMGATIDYAIVYTSYYRESRLKMGVKDSIINAYNKSINTIISSSTILIIVTLVVANFASAIAAKICETISQGTFAAVILILFMLPGVLATTDRLICKDSYKEKQR